MLILTTLTILFRQRSSENINSFSYNQSTNLPLAPLTFSSFSSTDELSLRRPHCCAYVFIAFVSPHLWLLRRPVSITALSLLCRPQHINCWTAIIHTAPSIFDTPTHSFSSSYSSTFPVPLKDLPLLLIMGVGREQQHTQNICGGQWAACRSEFSPST